MDTMQSRLRAVSAAQQEAVNHCLELVCIAEDCFEHVKIRSPSQAQSPAGLMRKAGFKYGRHWDFFGNSFILRIKRRNHWGLFRTVVRAELNTRGTSVRSVERLSPDWEDDVTQFAAQLLLTVQPIVMSLKPSAVSGQLQAEAVDMKQALAEAGL